MTQRQLERAVAAATGETVREIRRRGFGQIELVKLDVEDGLADESLRFADWDAIDESRHRIFPS